MSALLALAASHINTLSGSDVDFCIALSYRGRAIAGLREACARADHSAADFDVMLATCYSLTFQAALLPSDVGDFGTLIRGCALITERIQDGGRRTIFNNLSRGSIGSVSQSPTAARLGLDAYPEGSHFKSLLSKGIVSLYAAQACVGERYRGLSFMISLQSVFSGLQISPSTGYNRFIQYYTIWFKVAQDKKVFSGHSTEPEFQLLWAFFVSLQLFTTLLIDDVCNHGAQHQRPPELQHSAAAQKLMGLIEWLYAIEAMSPVNLRKHFAWSRLVCTEAISRFNMPKALEAGVQAKTAALCNFPTRSHYILGSILELTAGLANWTEDLLAFRGGDKASSTKEYWDTISAQTILGVLEQDRQTSGSERLHFM